MAERFFLGVGAQKAGTTWLYHQLKRHPEVSAGTRDRKELHYFDKAFATRDGKSQFRAQLKTLRNSIISGNTQAALNLVERIGTGFQFDSPEHYRSTLEQQQGLVSGEITPAYSLLAKSTYQIIQETIRPQIIFLMRDPLSRYWSATRMHAKLVGNGESTESLFRQLIEEPRMWGRSDYSTIVDLLDEVFGDQVLYLFYEDMFNESSLREVANHLDVTPEWPWDLSLASNVGTPADMPDPSPQVLDRLVPVYKRMRERFGSRIPDSWQY